MAGLVAVGVDGSEAATLAVDYAMDDAVRRRAALKIIHVREPWIGDLAFQDAGALSDAVNQHSRAVLAAAERRARERAPGVPVITSLVTGRVTEGLRAEAEGADVLVIGGRGLGGFAGLAVGSAGLGLAGHFPGPVVVVRQLAAVSYGQVVVGYDGSYPSEAALDYAFGEAERRNARLKVIYAWQQPVFAPYAEGYGPVLSRLFDERTAEIRRYLAPWREKNARINVDETSFAGHPIIALTENSRTADLVVVGSRGMGALGSAVLGSVSHGVLHRAFCPVAVVRPPGEGR
ncbi:universal stress protein [Acrocarpospora catenulata]|uniref:universal stress protein n=1 Tax=Acrocarpospora catenulata TaxID=2836182 RepID=UPI001BD9E0E0|nr:universal stress protein [Acrocarpospora catenulata]